MSPIHLLVWASALCFQLANATNIGGWLAGHGPTTDADWAGRGGAVALGTAVWAASLLLNVYHDDELREIRRRAMRDARAAALAAEAKGGKADVFDAQKVYRMPQAGLFRYVLYPHYLCEWVEWLGFWIVGGWGCGPARTFFVNEVCTMLPRAIQGREWYVQRFGSEEVGSRKAIIPGLI